MFKKGVSIFEILIVALMIVIITAATSIMGLIGPLVSKIIGIMLIPFFIVLLISVVCTKILAKLKLMKLPNGSIYNIFGYIEIHVQDKCNGKKYEFTKNCCNMILYARDKKKKVMLDTNLIREKHLREIFGNAIKIYQPSIIQYGLNVIWKITYKNYIKRDCYRAIIDTSKLTEEQIKIIKSYTI